MSDPANPDMIVATIPKRGLVTLALTGADGPWVGMTASQALELAALLVSKAHSLSIGARSEPRTTRTRA